MILYHLFNLQVLIPGYFLIRRASKNSVTPNPIKTALKTARTRVSTLSIIVSVLLINKYFKLQFSKSYFGRVTAIVGDIGFGITGSVNFTVVVGIEKL